MNIGPYTLIDELGRGGMGVVIRAADTRNNRPVAIKLISGRGDQDVRTRMGLVREAGATALLRHPHIVSIYDVNQHRGHLYIVMEYLDGSSLDRLLRRQWPLSLKHRLKIIIQLCEALGHAHEQHIVHRDVKPANIFVLRDGNIKVVDFGLGALAQISKPQLTRWSGTIPFMSPEQVIGIGIDGRSDIWAAGITLYQLVAGKLPFAGETINSTFQQILNSPVPELSESIPLSEKLNRIIVRALHKDKEQRYPSAKMLAASLRELMLVAEDHRWIPPAVDPSGTVGIHQTTRISFDLTPEQGELPSNDPEVEAFIRQNEVPELPDADGTYKPLDLGFSQPPHGTLEITSGRFGWMMARRKAQELRSIVLKSTVIMSVVAGGFLLNINKLNSWFFYTAASGIAAFWLILSVAIMVTWLLDKLTSQPMCPTCRQPMLRKSLWTRFVKSNAEVVLGYRDCVAALRSNFWEDAAKLLCIHGAEHTSLYASRSIDTPLRYNLEFFECEICLQRAARLTTESLLEENWLTQPEFVQANQGRKNQTAKASRLFVGLLRRTFSIWVGLLAAASRVRFNAKIYAFIVAGCAFLLVGAYYLQRDFKQGVRRTAATEKLVAAADRAYFGLGRDRNLALAAEYYKKAAEKGDSYSVNNLAEMLEEGKGVPTDSKEALRWYQVAANRGNAKAQYNLGRFYEEGICIPVDKKQAMRWYQKAAYQGNGCADFSLGRFYEDGTGGLKDPERAQFWYQNAVRLGYPGRLKCRPSPLLHMQDSNTKH